MPKKDFGLFAVHRYFAPECLPPDKRRSFNPLSFPSKGEGPLGGSRSGFFETDFSLPDWFAGQP
jgi:hypothetical protein